jgi:lysophospholipase L1-like esterase
MTHLRGASPAHRAPLSPYFSVLTRNGSVVRALSVAACLFAFACGSNGDGTSGGAGNAGQSGASAAGGASGGGGTRASGSAGSGVDAAAGAGGGSPGTGGSSPGNGGSAGNAGASRGTGGTSSGSGGAPSTGPGGANGSGGTDSGASGGTRDSGVAGGSLDGGGPSVPLDPALLSRCTGTSPITCTIPEPNGNYNVTVELGSAAAAATSLVQSETRRDSAAQTSTAAGAFFQQTFSVNVRQEVHDGGQSAVGNVLNLLIEGSAPALHGLGIAPAPSAVTLFIASDSTAADWDPINTSALGPDERGWAQELTQYLKPGLAVANYADSGETAGTFYTRFWPAARALLKAGDFVFIQFGHNDQKVDLTLYQPALMRYITDARAARATPVIVTPPGRRTATAADAGFAGLDQQARDLAAQQGVALIDLTTLSIAYYRTVANLPSLFATLAAGGGNDSTHFAEGGATQIAGLVAQAMKSSTLPLNAFVR